MFFEKNGKTFAVKFQREGTSTMAVLYSVSSDGTLEYTGIFGLALLHHNDRFEKSKGRKVALTDLLYQLSVSDEGGVIPSGLDKEARETIWKEYFRTHKK